MFGDLLSYGIGRGQWIEKEVRGFIYGKGKNPFRHDRPSNTPFGVEILKDAFELDFERPNVNHFKLIEMEIAKERHEF